MLAIQPIHILVIILVALIFFAPSRLPMVVRGFKKMFSEFRDEVSGKGKDDHNNIEPPPARKR